MQKSAIETQGIRFYRADPNDSSSPLTFLPIGKITSFKGPGGEASEIDTTTFDSVAKEFLLGLPDEGTFDFTMNLDSDDAQHAALRDDRIDRALRSFQVVLTDEKATTLSFSGLVKGYTVQGRAEGVVTVDVSIRISGAVVYTHTES